MSKHSQTIIVKNGHNISYVIPQYIKVENTEPVELKFRVKKPCKNVNVIVKQDDNVIKKLIKTALIPSEMEIIKINVNDINLINNSDILVEIQEK